MTRWRSQVRALYRPIRTVRTPQRSRKIPQLFCSVGCNGSHLLPCFILISLPGVCSQSPVALLGSLTCRSRVHGLPPSFQPGEAMLESLEMRLHFSVAIIEQDDGLLEVSGTDDPDNISIS